jgi:hypothetical protein
LVRHDTSMATRSISYLLLSEKTSSLRMDLECWVRLDREIELLLPGPQFGE